MQLKHIIESEVSQYTITVSCVLEGKYRLLTANVRALQATVYLTLRLVFNAVLIISVCLHRIVLLIPLKLI